MLSKIQILKLQMREGATLGSPLGSKKYVTKGVEEKVKEWCWGVENLSAIAATQPHAAYSHGLFGKWTYWLQTCADIESLLVPLEESLRMKFIPSLMGRLPPNDDERDILALPPRLGDLGLRSPVKSCSGEYTASRKICQPLVEKVISQSMSYPFEVLEAQYMARAEVRQSRRQQQSDKYEKLLTSVPNSLHKPLKLAQEKG